MALSLEGPWIPLEIFSFSHGFCVATSLFFILYIPRLIDAANGRAIRYVVFIYTALVVHLQFLELHIFTMMYGREWKTILPLQLCDFSAAAMVIYFFTRKRFVFSCAYFWGIPFAGMAMLTPNSLYGFPSPDYLVHQYGHAIVLLGISMAMYLFGEKPTQKDIFKVSLFTLILLPVVYLINYFLGEPANYWFLLSKPTGDNLMALMPAAPYHIVVLIPLTILVFAASLLPVHLRNKLWSHTRVVHGGEGKNP